MFFISKKLGEKNNRELAASMSKGFTLLEVIISIFVLTIGVLAVQGVISNSSQIIRITKKSVIAANLAQEGIEVIRGIRDGNWIQGEVYDTGLSFGDSCVNYNSIALIVPCADNTIYWDGSKYSHGGGTATDFARTINITSATDLEGAPFLRIQSTVVWGTRTITVEDHLYDWR